MCDQTTTAKHGLVRFGHSQTFLLGGSVVGANLQRAILHNPTEHLARVSQTVHILLSNLTRKNGLEFFTVPQLK